MAFPERPFSFVLTGPDWPSSGKLPSENQPCLQSSSGFGTGESFLKGQPVPELTQAERVAWSCLPDLWFDSYSLTLPQSPWQQPSLRPAGKIPYSNLAPVPSRDRPELLGKNAGMIS